MVNTGRKSFENINLVIAPLKDESTGLIWKIYNEFKIQYQKQEKS